MLGFSMMGTSDGYGIVQWEDGKRTRVRLRAAGSEVFATGLELANEGGWAEPETDILNLVSKYVGSLGGLVESTFYLCTELDDTRDPHEAYEAAFGDFNEMDGND